MTGQRLKTVYVDLLPPLSTEEFSALKTDINQHGQRDPIVIDEDGNILDGAHRYKILKTKAKTVVQAGLSDAEKEAFVFRANFTRRNLSPEQKREAAKRMRATAVKLREEDAKYWTQARLATVFGVARETVRDWFRTIGESANGSTRPDARVKLNRQAKVEAVNRLAGGETQQQVAADYGVSQKAISNVLAKHNEEQEKHREEEEAAEKGKQVTNDWLRLGDFRDVLSDIPNESVELIFTDPPYARESVPLYADLAELADRILINGGSLITYLGQYNLPEVIDLLSVRLKFFWPLACYHTGGLAQMREYGVRVRWKPMLWFVKGDFRRDRHQMVDDLIESSQEKSHHSWQQSVVEASYYIERLTSENALVVDPFCGGGTTAVAAMSLNRRVVTCDIDPAAIHRSEVRIDSVV